MNSGMRNAICNIMMWLLVSSALMFIVTTPTLVMGNPYALPTLWGSGLLFVLLFVELRWNPIYSAVAWIASKLRRS